MNIQLCMAPMATMSSSERMEIAEQALRRSADGQLLLFSENPFLQEASHDVIAEQEFLSRAQTRHIDVVWQSASLYDGEVELFIEADSFDLAGYLHRCERLRQQAIAQKGTVLWIQRLAYQAPKLYAGGALSWDANGIARVIANPFQRYDIVSAKLTEAPVSTLSRIDLLYRALCYGLKMSFEQAGIQRAVLGLSGGIDSAVVLPLAVAALSSENVTGVLLPSRYTSQASIEDAQRLAQNLGVSTHTISITEAYDILRMQVEPCVTEAPDQDLMNENIQARLRGLILMAFANAQRAAVINTTNKSEACMGYGTLYGDLVGMVSVLGDVYKGDVYDLARHINAIKPVIPHHSIDRAPSAELRPDQQDSDTLPPYPLIDEVMDYYLHRSKADSGRSMPEVESTLFENIVKRYKAHAYKRPLAPRAIRVSDTAFGVDIPY